MNCSWRIFIYRKMIMYYTYNYIVIINLKKQKEWKMAFLCMEIKIFFTI